MIDLVRIERTCAIQGHQARRLPGLARPRVGHRRLVGGDEDDDLVRPAGVSTIGYDQLEDILPFDGGRKRRLGAVGVVQDGRRPADLRPVVDLDVARIVEEALLSVESHRLERPQDVPIRPGVRRRLDIADVFIRADVDSRGVDPGGAVDVLLARRHA